MPSLFKACLSVLILFFVTSNSVAGISITVTNLCSNSITVVLFSDNIDPNPFKGGLKLDSHASQAISIDEKWYGTFCGEKLNFSCASLGYHVTNPEGTYYETQIAHASGYPIQIVPPTFCSPNSCLTFPCVSNTMECDFDGDYTIFFCPKSQ